MGPLFSSHQRTRRPVSCAHSILESFFFPYNERRRRRYRNRCLFFFVVSALTRTSRQFGARDARVGRAGKALATKVFFLPFSFSPLDGGMNLLSFCLPIKEKRDEKNRATKGEKKRPNGRRRQRAGADRGAGRRRRIRTGARRAPRYHHRPRQTGAGKRRRRRGSRG